MSHNCASSSRAPFLSFQFTSAAEVRRETRHVFIVARGGVTKQIPEEHSSLRRQSIRRIFGA
jgi:hypothetical protein